MKNIFLFSLLLVLVVGCDRLQKEDSSKIQIQMPAADLSSKVSAATYGTRPTPDGLSNVAGVNTPINCYIVAVGGPEAEMSRNTCSRDDGSRIVKVGQWSGGIAPGQSISLNVPSGKNRTFYIIGLHAADGYCKDFKAGFPEDNYLSKPYVVGKVENVTLNAGETKDLPVQVGFSTDAWFDDCVGPDFPESNHGDSGSTPTAIQFRKEYFPYSTFVENTCQSIDVSLINASGNGSILNSAVEFQVEINGSRIPVYNNLANCQAGTNPSNNYTLPANTNYRQFAFRTPTSSGTNTSLNFQATNIISSSSLTSLGLVGIPNVASDAKTFEIDAPLQMLSGICYPVNIFLKYASGSMITGPTGLTANFAGVGVLIYDDASCTTSSSSFGFSSVVSKLLYVKMPSIVNNASFTVTDTSSSGFLAAKRTLYSGKGSSNPASLSIVGYTQLTGINQCERYRVSATNEYGVPVLVTSDLSYSVTSTAPGGYQIYGSAGCSAATPLAITAGSLYSDFYFNNNTISAYGNQTLTATATGLNPGSLPLFIDGPNRWIIGINSSATHNACLPITLSQGIYSGSMASNFSSAFHLTSSNPSITVTAYDNSACTINPTTLGVTQTTFTGIGSPIFTKYLKFENIGSSTQTTTINISDPLNILLAMPAPVSVTP